MKRFIYLLSITSLLLSSCSDKEKQLNNEKYILGDWLKIKSQRIILDGDTEKVVLIPPEFYKLGFSFYTNNKLEKYPGFFRYNKRDTNNFYNTNYSFSRYLGNTSKYTISADSLKIFESGENSWFNYHIDKLDKDTLKISQAEISSTFVRLKEQESNTPAFDKIILSTSSCFGPCPILNIMINSDGTLIFHGKSFTAKNGFFSGRITRAEYNKLQNNFRKVDFDSLENEYSAGGSDQSTTSITFIKGDIIYKTISDYGDDAPVPFVWAYTPLENLYQLVSFTNLTTPDYFYGLYSFNTQASTLILEESERFLLINYLINGKVSHEHFKPRFKMKVYKDAESDEYYNLTTDGRYYKLLLKGKPVTIDIGFNFYDNNVKHWKWEKK